MWESVCGSAPGAREEIHIPVEYPTPVPIRQEICVWGYGKVFVPPLSGKGGGVWVCVTTPSLSWLYAKGCVCGCRKALVYSPVGVGTNTCMCGTPLLPGGTPAFKCVCVNEDKRSWLVPRGEEATHVCLKHPSRVCTPGGGGCGCGKAFVAPHAND